MKAHELKKKTKHSASIEEMQQSI